MLICSPFIINTMVPEIIEKKPEEYPELMQNSSGINDQQYLGKFTVNMSIITGIISISSRNSNAVSIRIFLFTEILTNKRVNPSKNA